jgi:hypothetical protein
MELFGSTIKRLPGHIMEMGDKDAKDEWCFSPPRVNLLHLLPEVKTRQWKFLPM